MDQPNLPGEILAVFRDLGIGLNNHSAWLKRLHRSLVCGEEAVEDDFSLDAHHKCLFGQWYDGDIDERLKKLPQFAEVGELHQQIHSSARELLALNKNANDITTEQYDNFIDITHQFRVAIQSLQYAMVSEVCAVDHLTGVWNLYALSYKLSRWREKVRFTGTPCVIAMMNFDHLGVINDQYGYLAGNTVMSTVMESLSTLMKDCGDIFRYSSEEFLFILADSDIETAKDYFNQLRQNVKDMQIKLHNGTNIHVTVSLGLSLLDASNSEEDVIGLAKHAVISAKAGGRDRVCVW